MLKKHRAKKRAELTLHSLSLQKVTSCTKVSCAEFCPFWQILQSICSFWGEEPAKDVPPPSIVVTDQNRTLDFAAFKHTQLTFLGIFTIVQ